MGLLAMLIGSVCFQRSASAEALSLYVIAGQSNMSGRVSTGFVPVEDIDEDVLYFFRADGPASNNQTSRGSFQTLSPLGTGFYGPEISLARMLHGSVEDKIAIVKVSDGGTSLATDWNSRATRGNTWWQNWVADTTEALNDLEEMGFEPVLKGLCWLQGETDAEGRREAAAYEENFQNLVTDMYAQLGSEIDVSSARFVTAGIGVPNEGIYLNANTVRAAQESVMDSNANWFYFDTQDLNTFDGVHFDVPSVTEIGDRFAEALLVPPSISILEAPDGTVEVSFSGILYESEDLQLWNRVDPQPSSPLQITPASGRSFFDSRSE